MAQLEFSRLGVEALAQFEARNKLNGLGIFLSIALGLYNRLIGQEFSSKYCLV